MNAIMKVYERIWEDTFRRTVILSSLFTIWILLVESYFIFFPIEETKVWGSFLPFKFTVLGKEYIAGLVVLHTILLTALYFFVILLTGNLMDFFDRRMRLSHLFIIAAIIIITVFFVYGLVTTLTTMFGIAAVTYLLYYIETKKQLTSR